MMAYGTPESVTCERRALRSLIRRQSGTRTTPPLVVRGEWDATMEGTFNESWSDPLWHEESGGADHE